MSVTTNQRKMVEPAAKAEVVINVKKLSPPARKWNFYERPAIYREGNDLVLIGGATIPGHICIKTGQNVEKEFTTTLRNPFDPRTWITSRRRVKIGLSPRSLRNYRIQLAVAYLNLVLGLAMIPFGICAGIGIALVGLLLTTTGLILRAHVPVRAVFCSKNKIVIKGCGEPFLHHF